MASIKIPLVERTPTAQAGGARRQGVLSFGYFDQPFGCCKALLCTSKEKWLAQ